MARFPMSLDRTHRVLTVVVIVLLVAVFGAMSMSPAARLGWPVMILVGIALVISWAMAPSALVVDGDELRIERRWWRSLRVPRSAVERAEALPSLSGRTLRLMGVGGFFGSYGLFTNRDLGRFRLYATRRSDALIVRRNDGRLPLVITPDDVPAAVAALGERRA